MQGYDRSILQEDGQSLPMPGVPLHRFGLSCGQSRDILGQRTSRKGEWVSICTKSSSSSWAYDSHLHLLFNLVHQLHLYVCRQSLTSLLQKGMSVLLVLDPNWQLCYETVEIDDFAREGLLSWVSGLRDALTLHPGNPDGDFLKVQ